MISSPPASEATEAFSFCDRPDLPGIFLMTDSFATGGSERQFVALAGSLDRNCFRVHLGCIQKTGGFLDGFENAAEFRLGGSLYSFKSWRTRMRLGYHLRRSRISIAHAFDFYTNLALAPVARMAGVAAVIGSQRQMGDLLSPAKARAQFAAFHFCDRIVCNSQAAARALTDQGIGRRRVVVIGNGLPASAFAPAQPALPRAPGIVRVGMIARMNTPAKNHKLLLRAAARLVSNFPLVQFVLVGDGPLRQELEKEAEILGLGARALFLGDRRDIPAILASLDISVLPSESESQSNAILEAMAAGVPVVASNTGGNPELAGEGRGILVRCGDEHSLAQGIAKLLQNNELRQVIGEHAKGFVKRNFTIESMRSRFEELYADLIAEKTALPDLRSRSFPQREARTRVAIVAASLSYIGGQSVQADLLMRNWKHDRDVDAKWIVIDPPFPATLRWAAAVPGLRTVLRQPLYAWRLWKDLEGADIAHIFSASYWSFIIAPVPAAIVARIRGARVLIHYHSGEARDHFRRFPNAPRLLGRADRLVVPTQFLVDVFHEFGLRAEVVPNIIDLSQFSFRKRKPLRPHLVCTRGFHPYYSIELVVRAFAEVQRAYPDARLDLVGGGPVEGEIRALVEELNLVDSVRFCGVVSRDQIAGCYDRADIFINASWLDNMPVSILEAFASGTPVVSTSPEGMRYVVEDGRTGLLSPVADVQKLAENVLRLLNDPDFASTLAMNAFEQSREYGWNVVRTKWLKIYDSMLNRMTPVRGEFASDRLVGNAEAVTVNSIHE
jgi:L-malate glycosyltransferase